MRSSITPVRWRPATTDSRRETVKIWYWRVSCSQRTHDIREAAPRLPGADRSVDPYRGMIATILTPFVLRHAHVSSGAAHCCSWVRDRRHARRTDPGGILRHGDVCRSRRRGRRYSRRGARARGCAGDRGSTAGRVGVLWGLVPLAMQTDVLSGTPDAPEASSAVLNSVLQLGDAIGQVSAVSW